MLCALLSLALLSACDGEGPSLDGGPAPSDSGPVAPMDAGVTPPADDAGPPPPSDPPSEPDSGVAASSASLVGVVTRTAEPRAGGVGHLYVAVFDRDPVLDRDSARVVGNARVDDADMREPGAAVPYRVDGLPPRSEPYFVIAFLDDNANVDPSAPGPDRGDLVSLNGLSAPSVTAAGPGDVALDIVLNTNLPF